MALLRKIYFSLSLLILSFFSITSYGQSDGLLKARLLADTKQYEEAFKAYDSLYSALPGDVDVYKDYYHLLLDRKKYKEAEKLVAQQIKLSPQSQVLFVDMGFVFESSGKRKKAEEEYDAALNYINGDDILTQRLAGAFEDIGRYDYAINSFEKARNILRNPYLYYSPLARLYAKTGETSKSINALLDGAPGNIGGIEDTKATMLEVISDDPKKLDIAQKTVIQRINSQPENSFFGEMLTWLYTQKDDWDGALLQVEAIDYRNKENGQRVMRFARTAARAGKFETAKKGLDHIIEMGKEYPMYTLAKADKLEISMQQLRQSSDLPPAMIQTLIAEYKAFFDEYPQYYAAETILDYAELLARFGNQPDTAIALLEKALSQPSASRQFTGKAKLQLGDYKILVGDIWDASLLYSQVDKSFREDAMGEEARFRNGKLAYYRGDFPWAQDQLSVLKASTSELIANDALYLSVLITENIPSDSNILPLQRFAYADLLLFQNKLSEAKSVLDSLTTAFPKHPLTDDILMLKVKLDIKKKDFTAALDHLKDIYILFGKDVLADDAVFQTATIYEEQLQDREKAKTFYEKLIIDYPGSTYVQTARKKLDQLSENTAINTIK